MIGINMGILFCWYFDVLSTIAGGFVAGNWSMMQIILQYILE